MAKSSKCVNSEDRPLSPMIEQLPTSEFEKLAEWMSQRRRQIEATHVVPDGMEERSKSKIEPYQRHAAPTVLRDRSAFLNSYAPSDEGLYDDAEPR